MPVWPVARKVAGTPRAVRARVRASAVYFLPSAQRQGDEPVYREVKIMMIGGGAEKVMKELAARQLGL